jgi:hypothetical protein
MIEEVLTKTSQCVQNEGKLISKYNELRKKYGLAHYCLSRYRELGSQLQQNTDRVLYSGALGGELEDLVNCVQGHFFKCKALEESPEYAFVQSDV